MQPFGSEGDSSPVRLFQVPPPGWATHSLGFAGRPADRLKLEICTVYRMGMDGWMDQPFESAKRRHSLLHALRGWSSKLTNYSILTVYNNR